MYLLELYSLEKRVTPKEKAKCIKTIACPWVLKLRQKKKLGLFYLRKTAINQKKNKKPKQRYVDHEIDGLCM
jgi:hypothetical protein